MELLYVWIDGYKGLSNIGINFSNRFRFDFDPATNELKIKPSENFIPAFFANNISNFTGIVGINSAGKTSVLRYILEYCSHGASYEKERISLVIFNDEEQLYYYSKDEIVLLPEILSKQFKRVKDLDLFKRSKETIYLSTHFDPTSLKSNDYTRMQLGNTKNLSTWYLLHSDIGNITGKDPQLGNTSLATKMAAFASQEFIRIVRLLRWIKNDESRNPFPVDVPPYLNLKLYFNSGSPNKKSFEKLSTEFNRHFPLVKKDKNYFLLKAFEAAIFHFIDREQFVISSKEIKGLYLGIHTHILQFLNARTLNKRHKDPSIIYVLNDIIYDIIKAYSVFNKELSEIQVFLNELSAFLDRQHASVIDEGYMLTFKLETAVLSSLKDFVDAFYKVDRIGSYVEFYFSHYPGSETSLSSGEYTMLTLFGRLNSLKINKNKPLLLLVDEAELALHPQWQKQFVSIFSNFISERFVNHNVQVIITSHSPFILSDLPPHCVVLLKKDNNGTKVIDSLETKKETFGANIHELFTDAFFLQDGLMGEFARNKIEDLITEIQKDKGPITSQRYNAIYRKRIDIIGERFLKTKIRELIGIKADLETIDEIIGIHSNELHILNELRNQKWYDQNK